MNDTQDTTQDVRSEETKISFSVGLDFEFKNYTPKKLELLYYPSERLRNRNTNVETFDEDLEHLILDMFYTMRVNNGVGIAAPQVGVHKRLSVLMFEQPLILVNPVLVAKSKEMFTFEEGCLSVPGYFAEKQRPRFIRVAYQNEKGEQMELSATELTAFCILHEMDHLDGKLFVDDLSMLKRSRAKKKVKDTLRSRTLSLS